MHKPDRKIRFLRHFAGFTRHLPLNLLIRMSGKRCILPFYHTVSDRHLPHIRPLYAYHSASSFRRELAFLLRHFQPASVEEFIKRHGCRPGKNQFLLSFDDGLRDIKETVVPVLKEKGIPAIFFINTGFVDNRALFFKHKAALLYEAWRQKAHLPMKAIQNVCAQAGLPSANPTPEQVLQIPFRQAAILDDFAQLLEVDFSEFLQQEKPYLSWQEIRVLHDEGFTIGTHTAAHPLMGTLSLREQLEAIRRPFETLKQHIPVKTHLFSFPFTDDGLSHAFFRQLFHAAQPAADLTFAGAGLKKQSYNRHFQRIPMEIEGFRAKEIIHTEYAYYLLKALVGKNRIKRS